MKLLKAAGFLIHSFYFLLVNFCVCGWLLFTAFKDLIIFHTGEDGNIIIYSLIIGELIVGFGLLSFVDLPNFFIHIIQTDSTL